MKPIDFGKIEQITEQTTGKTPTLKQRISSGILAAALFLQLTFAGCAIAPSYEKPPVIKNKYTQFYSNLLELQKHQNEMPEFEVNEITVNAVVGDTVYRSWSDDTYRPFGGTYYPNDRFRYDGCRVVLPVADRLDKRFILIYISRSSGYTRFPLEAKCSVSEDNYNDQTKRFDCPDIRSNNDGLQLILADIFSNECDGKLDGMGILSYNYKDYDVETHSFYFSNKEVSPTGASQEMYDKIVDVGNSVLPSKIGVKLKKIEAARQQEEKERIKEQERVEQEQNAKNAVLQQQVNSLYDAITGAK